jgi:hypothetical protein
VVSALAALLLTTCGTAQKQDPSQMSPTEIVEKARTIIAGCNAIPELPKDAVNRAKCFNDADTLLAPIARFPDLVEQRIAKRTELAQAMASGSITRAKAVSDFTEVNRQLVAEEFKRLKSNPPAEARQRAVSEGTALF